MTQPVGVFLVTVILVTAVSASSPWSQWSCVAGSWRRSATQFRGRCGGQDVINCKPAECRGGGQCCREGSVCNSALGGQPRPGASSRWLVCWCQAGVWDKCVIK